MNAEHETPEWLKFVDHTADAGIAVEAPDLVRLFERAALLVRWLSELNYRHVIEHRIFAKFEVVTLSEQHLEADVSGEIFDPARHTIFTEIKAVTFHDLQFERDERGWKVQIIFDL